jgi:hypothetical protein
MNQVYPNVQLPKIIARTVAPSVDYHLFVNDFEPGRTTTLADLTEAAWAGYNAVPVGDAEWLDTGVSGDVDIWIHSAISFANSSGADQSAFGYYATDAEGELLLVARFDSAPLVRSDGESFIVILTIGDFSGEL